MKGAPEVFTVFDDFSVGLTTHPDIMGVPEAERDKHITWMYIRSESQEVDLEVLKRLKTTINN